MPDFSQRKDEFRVLAFGKFGRYKRLEVMLDAWPEVRKQVPKAKLVIAGQDHPNRAGYMAGLAEQHKDDTSIEFLGYLPEEKIGEVFRRCNVAVLPYSSSGGPSGVAHPAAQFGLPLIGSTIGDIVNVCTEEGLAIDYFRTDDAGDLAEKIIALTRDPERERRMAEQNYAAALGMTMPPIVEQYLNDFREYSSDVAAAAVTEVSREPLEPLCGAAGRQEGGGMKGRIRYSIVIPAYNEERCIAATLDHVMRYLAERNVRAEIIVVDDGSTDRTAEMVMWYRRKTYRVKLLRLQHQGKGSAVRRGVKAAHGQIVFLCDADMHEGVAEFEKLEAALLAGAHIAIGSRWEEHCESTDTQPFYRRACSRVFNLCTQRLLGLKFHDTQCGLKAFTRDAAKDLCGYQSINGWGYDPELLFVAVRLGYKVAEVPIKLHHDYTNSKFRPVQDGFITIKDLFQILWRDLLESYPRPMPAPAAVSGSATSVDFEKGFQAVADTIRSRRAPRER